MAAAVLRRAGGAAGVRRVRERRAPTEPMIDRLHWLAVVAAFGLLTGCGTYGDFGRVRPSLVNDDTHAWMGPAAARGPATNLAWRHQLTEEERTQGLWVEVCRLRFVRAAKPYLGYQLFDGTSMASPHVAGVTCRTAPDCLGTDVSIKTGGAGIVATMRFVVKV